MYLIFDTETTGLPKNYNAPVSDVENWPRLVQLSWQLHEANGQLIAARDFIVKPEGFTIPFNAEKVHGISTERAENEGYSLEEVLETFGQDVEQASLLVGHNIDFDLKIVGAEYYRKEKEDRVFQKDSLDTKEASTDFCKIPGGKGGKYKWPTLSELHQKLFGEAFDDAHNAAFDVDATARCFFGLLKERVVTPVSADIPVEEITYEQPDLEASKGPEPKGKEAPSSQPDPGRAKDVADQIATEVKAFSHLHNHTQYSILQSTLNIKKMVAEAKENGMPAVAVTDHGNLFGAFNAVREGNKQGVKVIVGCELYMVEDRHEKKFTKGTRDYRNLQVFLAKNQNGYQNLAKLCSLGYVEGYYGGYPRVDKNLIQEYKTDLITLTGGLWGEIPDLILNKGEHQAEEAFQWWHKTFGDDFYVELQDHGLEEEKRVNEVLLKFAERYGVKGVATNNVYYLHQGDAQAHDTLLCVNAGELQSTPIGSGRGYRYGFRNDQYYFKSPTEMGRIFHNNLEALNNTDEVVSKIETLQLEREILLPNYSLPEGYKDQNEYLEALSYEGARQRYGQISQEIDDRLQLELKIIRDMGFPGYFLIVQDLINKAREMGVAVGPGRGSAAGSVVAYCTGITNIDPIHYNLIFERFLNPERVSMPDIDIDFDDDGRQQVIDYVVEKYGQNQVAQIITFGTMAPKMSIRDVARVLELPLSEANQLAKLVPEKPGTTFQGALEEVPELKAIKEGNDQRAEILNRAETLVGSVRNAGIHAAGVIIAPDDMLEYIPIKTDKDSDLFITQFDGSVVEDAGMLKMDFLGLKTLTIIKDAVKMVKRNHDISIDTDEIPLDDENTFALYQRGDTVGTFQFESEGMRQWLQKLQPTSVEDLIAMNALYRPGPMQFIPNFIDRKHGREKVDYPHPLLEPILKNSHGIMVYQEQIMQTAQKMAGYSLGGADILRRAMGKKKLEEMERQREIFIKGAWEKNGIEKDKAEDIWKVMEKFAQYGFNRSHSAAYSIVAYQTGYLKANYPAEYMASVLTHNMNNIDKVTHFMDECRRKGIKVLGPDVNESSYYFDTNAQGQIRFGLGGIKGAGEAAVVAIIDERSSGGPYKDIFDFARRVNLRAVNKKTFESLAMAGGFDCFSNYHRRQYLFSDNGKPNLIEKAIKYASSLQNEANAAQQSLFGGNSGVEVPLPKVEDCEPYGEIQKLNLEKDVVGFYISGHPLDEYKVEIDNFCSCTVDRIEAFKNQEIAVAGIITKSLVKHNKYGKPFGIFTIEDFQGSLDMILFGETFLKNRHLLNEGEFVFVKGKVQQNFRDAEKWELRPDQIHLLSEVREKMANGLNIACSPEMISDELIEKLAMVSKNHPGTCPVNFTLKAGQDDMEVNLRARAFSVNPTNDFFRELENFPEISLKLLS